MKDILDDINVGMGALTNSGAEHFSPARFFYITSLVEKTQKLSGNIRQIVGEKALHALQSYTNDFHRAKRHASAIVKDTRAHEPDVSEQLDLLLENGKFNEVKRLSARLLAQRPSPIDTLGDKLNTDRRTEKKDNMPPAPSFESSVELQRQHFLGASENIPGESNIESAPEQLKAFIGFREFKEKYDTDRLVRKIIDECPADMGPLNPHMLLVRSIESMRDLSPHYLSRFVT